MGHWGEALRFFEGDADWLAAKSAAAVDRNDDLALCQGLGRAM
jgi:hypothetical protein